MNAYKRIILLLLNLFGAFFMFFMPLIVSYKYTFGDLEPKHAMNFYWIIPLFVLSVVYFTYIKKLVWRKLNARTTAEEFGIQGTTSPILIRFIKAIEIFIPIAPVAGLSFILTKINPNQVWYAFVALLIFLAASQVIFLIHDILKHNWMIDVEAKRRLKVERRMNRLRIEEDEED